MMPMFRLGSLAARGGSKKSQEVVMVAGRGGRKERRSGEVWAGHVLLEGSSERLVALLYDTW